MYSLDTPLDTIKGIGPKLFEKFQEKNISTFKDLLLFLPLRYSDRSEITQIKDLEVDKLVSFPANISKVSSFFKNRRKIDSATATDSSGKVKLMWFNNKYIASSVKPGELYMVSGKLNNRGTLIQPTLEKITEKETASVSDDAFENTSKEKENEPEYDTIHTGRLVPIYSSTLDIQQGKLRRVLKQAIEKYSLNTRDDENSQIVDALATHLLDIKESLSQLHFPDSEDHIAQARERLALEELLALIKTSEEVKNHWKNLHSASQVTIQENKIPDSIPFELTGAQLRCIDEILQSITQDTPMNRMLIGDVGSGKTVVAGTACYHALNSGYNVALVAPTKILAKQHLETLQETFPNLTIKLITGGPKSKKQKEAEHTAQKENTTPTFYVGTHAVINKLEALRPALVIYDEQHRFGVNQRSQASNLAKTAHTLTMSATPIPRSLMLTIFSHLQVSTIDELPKGRLPTKTWVVPEQKREASYEWIVKQLNSFESESDKKSNLALVVCPFIDPSNHEAFENVASANETFTALKASFAKIPAAKKLKVGLLHGRMKKTEQEKIISNLYSNKIDVLVTTPIVEVGVDLPTAAIIVIEASERFGMASLHQLRGRVGRAGQQGYCLLFSETKSKEAKKRLEDFSNENNGLKLAELDLKRRGSGDIFGVQQSGFSNLRFASWTNLELIAQAKQVYEKLPKKWQPLVAISANENPEKPLAN